MASRFVHDTVTPALTVRLDGLNANPEILTEFCGGGGGGVFELVGLLLLEQEESAPIRKSVEANAARYESLCLFMVTPFIIDW